MKKMWIAFAAALPLLLGLRLFQMFTQRIPKSIYPMILLGMTLILTAIQLLTAALNRKTKAPYLPVKNIFCGILGILPSFAIIYRSVYDLYNFIVLKEFATRTFIDQHPFVYVILSVIGLFAALILLIESISDMAGIDPLRKLPLLTLTVPVWYCFILIVEFITSISRHNSVENSIEALSMAFILLFLFFRAKFLSGINESFSRHQCFIFGLPAVITSLASSVFVFIADFLKIEAVSGLSFSQHIINISFGCSILAYLIVLSCQKISLTEQATRDVPEIGIQNKPSEELSAEEPLVQELPLLKEITPEEPSAKEIPTDETIPGKPENAESNTVKQADALLEQTQEIMKETSKTPFSSSDEEEFKKRMRRINEMYESIKKDL